MNANKKANFLKMFNANRPVIVKHTQATLEEIEVAGKEAVKRMEWVRNNALQMSGHEYNHTMHSAVQQVKILRCAWYAVRYGWAK